MSDREELAGHRRLALLLLLAAFATLAVPRACGGPSGLRPEEKRGAPRQLAFVLLDGGTWRLTGERGHVVAVNLWATWCGPCRAEIPLLVRMNEEEAAHGFRVAGISLDDAVDKAALVGRFRSAYHVSYPLGFPPATSQMTAGLDAIPTTLLFDRQGRTAGVYMGQLRERAFRADVRRLLAEPGGDAPEEHAGNERRGSGVPRLKNERSGRWRQ